MPFRLLLIEDSPTQLLSIRKSLEHEGHEVISARTGAEGLVMAYNESPDLIISDVVMSGINGYQVCRLVKSDPDLQGTPVVLLTRLDGSIDRFWGLKSGADRYIPKEPGFSSLIKAVREILSDTSVRPRLRAVSDQTRVPAIDEINSRLNQLLERLLFEATIADEVRKIADDIGDIEVIAEKLFVLLGSFTDYQGCALVVNHGSFSVANIDAAKSSNEQGMLAYVMKIAMQLGLPALKEDAGKALQSFDHAITQPIDSSGIRLGLLVIIPPNGQPYKPGDQKVIRLVCEQLSTVIRLYLSYVQRQGMPVPTTPFGK
ncbi:MAG: response regulator [Candidatus Obscuribacterales bacterium]|nr:response regulator [Candidatus Obscuribacterales bacterium]